MLIFSIDLSSYSPFHHISPSFLKPTGNIFSGGSGFVSPFVRSFALPCWCAPSCWKTRLRWVGHHVGPAGDSGRRKWSLITSLRPHCDLTYLPRINVILTYVTYAKRIGSMCRLNSFSADGRPLATATGWWKCPVAIHGTSWHHGVNPCALQAITIVGGEQFCTYTGYARSLAFLGADSRHFILALHRITVLCVCCFLVQRSQRW